MLRNFWILMRSRLMAFSALLAFTAQKLVSVQLTVLLVNFSASAAVSLSDEPAAPTKPGPRKGRGYEMDYGSALSYTINCKQAGSREPDNLVLKGVAVRVSKDPLATICFDTESLRYAAGWTNGFLDISHTHLNSSKGSYYAFADGDLQFRTPLGPGWKARSSKYHGFYRSGEDVALSYAVNGVEILDSPGFVQDGNKIDWFERTLSIEAHSEPLSLILPDPPALAFAAGSTQSKAAVREGDQLILRPCAERGIVKLLVGRAMPHKFPNTDIESRLPAAMVDPKTLCAAAALNWPQILSTTGKLAVGSAPYVVDTLTMPEHNPWKSWMRFLAFDFFSDGRAAISTWSGDVWIVSGIDGKLNHLTWKR